MLFVDPEMGRERPFPGLRDIYWITGTRLMNLFGANKEREYRIMFNAKGASDGSDYPDISELLTKWNLVHVELEGEMEKVTDKQLNAPVSKTVCHYTMKRRFLIR